MDSSIFKISSNFFSTSADFYILETSFLLSSCKYITTLACLPVVFTDKHFSGHHSSPPYLQNSVSFQGKRFSYNVYKHSFLPLPCPLQFLLPDKHITESLDLTHYSAFLPTLSNVKTQRHALLMHCRNKPCFENQPFLS